MADKTKIEWTATYHENGTITPGATWPITVGCDRVSPGCDHCYAIRDGWRMGHNPLGKIRTVYEGLVFKQDEHLDWTGVTRCIPERLDWPLHWTRPRKIFVCSQSDLFHQDVPDDFIVEAFQIMKQADWHTFQVLTKRPSRLVNTGLRDKIERAIGPWPGHIWLGVSVESQDYLWRVDQLLKLPAPIRFISAEPLLGPLDALRTRLTCCPSCGYPRPERIADHCVYCQMYPEVRGISWVIAGAESGSGARPMNEDWVRGIRDQCIVAGVPLLYKQNLVNGKKVSLPELDGTVWNSFPS